MEPLTLLAELHRRGVEVEAAGDRLRYRPVDAVDPGLLAELKAHKVELLHLLAAPARPVAEAQEIVRLRWTADPRPDLADDSPLWSRLLALAFERHGDGPDSVFWLLQGLRCCGARLVAHDGRLRLEPRPDGERIGPFVHDVGAQEWGALRAKWLMPQRAAIEGLLEALTKDAAA